MNFILLTKYDGAIVGPVAKVLGYVMDYIFRFTDMFGVINIGVSIILFTIIIKGVMVPMTIKQQKFTKMNSIMAPELQAIQKKYKNKKDQASMMKQNEETMAIYNKYGVKPTGGCLQMLIQFPIMFALYRVVWNIPAYVVSIKNTYLTIVSSLMTVSDFATNEKFIELAKANNLKDSEIEMMANYMADNVANADSFAKIKDRLIDVMYSFDTKEWGTFKDIFSSIADNVQPAIDEIQSMNSFLGINLSVSPLEYITNMGEYAPLAIIVALLIPFLSGGVQWLSTKITSASQQPANKNKTKPEDENVMMQSMNTMVKIMPIMSIAFCFMFASCIGIYWIISSIVQLVTQVLVNRYLEKIDINNMVENNIKKINEKRAKQGLPPQKISKVANMSTRAIEVDEDAEERAAKKREEKIKKSTEYYGTGDSKSGSLASKAGMVKKYNEKNKK